MHTSMDKDSNLFLNKRTLFFIHACTFAYVLEIIANKRHALILCYKFWLHTCSYLRYIYTFFEIKNVIFNILYIIIAEL